MISQTINKISKKSKNLKFDAARNYKSHGRSSMPYKETIVLSPSHEGVIFLVHENMIFERNSISDSSYDVYSFNKDGDFIKKESVSELGKDFFRTMNVLKNL